MPKPSISVLQAAMLIVITIGLDNHVTLIPLLLRTANKDSWIAVLLAMPLCVLWSYLPYAIIKGSGNKPIVAWIRERAGPFVAIPAAAAFLFILFASSSITFKEMILWTKITYLPATPMLATSLALIALCAYSAYKGIKTIAITTGILLPFVWLLGYFVMFTNFQYKRYVLLFPSFTNPTSDIVNCMTFAASSFLQMFVIVFLQQHLRTKVKWRHLAILTLILVMLTIGPLTGSIASFGYEAPLTRYPAFEQWRLVKIGDYISHVDFLSIYQWLSGSYIFVALSLFMMTELVTSVAKVPKLPTILVLSLPMLVFVNLPQISDVDFMRLIDWHYRISLALIAAASLMLGAAALLTNKQRTEAS